MEHNLKIKPEFLRRLLSKKKTAEIRLNDKDYQTGDILRFNTDILFQDVIPDELYGKTYDFRITHILTSSQFPEGLKDNYVMLSLKAIN